VRHFQWTTGAISGGLHQPARYSPLSAIPPEAVTTTPIGRPDAGRTGLAPVGAGAAAAFGPDVSYPRSCLLVRGNNNEPTPVE
jgi:hypothetical protein